jgi:uncharacterized RDD family membrane protein YckC
VPPGYVPPQPGYGGGAPQSGFTAPAAGYAPGPFYYPSQIPVGPSGHRLAEFSDRLLAWLIDSAIQGLVSLVILVPVYIVAFISFFNTIPTQTTVNGQLVGPAPDPMLFFGGFLAFFAIVLLLTFGIRYLYEVEMMFRSGQTVGKRIMKIRIVPVDTTRVLTRGMAFKRYLVYVGASFLPGLGYVDGLWQLWDKPWRQCLHDKFAQTLVIKLDP